MANGMEEKIRTIDSYIQKLDDSIKNRNSTHALRLENEIVAVYEGEIPNLKGGLDRYGPSSLYSVGHSINYLGDAKLLRAKLHNYKQNLLAGLLVNAQNGNGGITVNQQVHQETKVSVEVSLENTIEAINGLPADILNAADKEVLAGKLATMQSAKDKNKRWEKAADILKWIADKGIEVGTAALPYIAHAIQNT